MTTATAVPTRQIVTRRISFEYPDGAIPRHFMGGDLVMSHVVAMLSALFPNGEDFFVQSVRNYRDQITDPELKKQVGKFIGQEAIHGREHRELNERLAELGFTTRFVDKAVGVMFKGFAARVLPKPVQVAVTAALEHYTATLAEVLMSSEEARSMITSDEIRNLLLWHALEESEHKAVAFDVFQAISGKQFMRARVMDVVTVLFLGAIADATFRSLRHDPAARDLRRLRSSLGRLRDSPFLTKEVRRRIRDYNRPDFHPDDHDNSALLARWREELFGSEGRLVARLPG
jgi:predicted metal-dependent hydrolase